MSVLRFLSKEKLVEYLDEELRNFLNDSEIYEITQYGWLADNQPDPDYLGLAMWQSDPPTAPQDLAGIVDYSEVSSDWEPRLSEMLGNGREFEELMLSARHSIGLGGLYFDNPEEMNPCFAFHYSETETKLTMATDRLRDFFVAAFATLPGFTAKEVNWGKCDPGEFSAGFCPFTEVRDILKSNPDTSRELLDCLTELQTLLEQLNSFRGSKSHLDSAGNIDDLTTWYQIIVNSADKIFLAEYLFRNFARPPRMDQIVEYL
jgi:hypothetical protein